jgi:hypothetical protein
MLTGYTAPVADGKITTLREFALYCARGMDALITMRDEPMDAPIPERFEPSDFYAKWRDEACARIRGLQVLTPEECETQAAADYERALAEWERHRAEKREQRARYEAMIAQVEAWETEAEGIRDLMLEQLRRSLEFDCKEYPDEEQFYPKPKKLDGLIWREEALRQANRDLASSAKSLEEETKRVEDRNQWLAKLRASLPAD